MCCEFMIGPNFIDKRVGCKWKCGRNINGKSFIKKGEKSKKGKKGKGKKGKGKLRKKGKKSHKKN